MEGLKKPRRGSCMKDAVLENAEALGMSIRDRLWLSRRAALEKTHELRCGLQ